MGESETKPSSFAVYEPVAVNTTRSRARHERLYRSLSERRVPGQGRTLPLAGEVDLEVSLQLSRCSVDELERRGAREADLRASAARGSGGCGPRAANESGHSQGNYGQRRTASNSSAREARCSSRSRKSDATCRGSEE